MLPKSTSRVNPALWNSMISTLPGAHILQTWEWGKIKAQFGWQVHHLIWVRHDTQFELMTNHLPDELKNKTLAAAALVLHRQITLGGFSHRIGVMYVPKGPLLDWNDARLYDQVLQDLKQFALKHSAIFIKIDPDLEIGRGVPGSEDSYESPQGMIVIQALQSAGWQQSGEQIQFRNTVLIDLHPTENELLARMKQKTRYNVNLAIRKGVSVRVGGPADIPMLFGMYAETSVRDDFVIRHEGYYHEVWNTFLRISDPTPPGQPAGEALIAEVDNEPIAAVLIFRYAGRGWYLYGMSTTAHREMMPNYLLQWEAMKRLKAENCITYDLWGAPDEFIETDPLWGVYRFKEGLGGLVSRTMGAMDLPINRMLYRLYTRTIPSMLNLMRNHGKANTKQLVE